MEVNQEIMFAKTLEQVRKQAKAQNNCIARAQVEEAFMPLALSKEQLAMVFDYLEKHRIGIDEPADPDEFLSEEEMDYLAEYQKELALIEPVSDGEREAITLSAMAGEKEAQQRLITLHLPDVMEIAKLYTGQGVFLEDLIGEGNVALAMGVTMLGCLEHAREAEGMLGKMIMDAMEDCITEVSEESDKSKKVLKRVKQVADRAGELSKELQRKVTIDELAAETGLSRKAIQDAMRFSGYTIEDIEKSFVTEE